MSVLPKTTLVSTRAIVLRAIGDRPRTWAALLTGSLMHAAGHAGLALLGGAVVVALGGGLPVRTGSTLMDVADPRALAFAAVAASAVRLVGSTLGAHASARMAGDVSTTLRARVLRALFAVHRLRHPRHADHGGVCADVSSLTSRIHEVTGGLESVLAVFRASLQLALLAAVVLVVAPKLFIVAALLLAPFAWLLSRVRARLRTIQREGIAHADALLEAADDAVRHNELWQSFGAQRNIQSVLSRLGDEARDRAAKLGALAAAQSGASELLGVLAFGLGLWALLTYAPDDSTKLAPFAVPFFLAYRPLRDLAEARVALGRASEAARTLDTLLSQSSGAAADEDDGDPAAREWPLGELVLEAVAHPRARFAPLDLRIAPGTIAAIVGPTGSGKTTLLRVLLGLDGAGSGKVHYAGISLDGAEPGPRARPFAWVPQEAPVLSATLEENVRLAAREEWSLEATLSAIGAERLLALRAERLGAGHRALSGGERQWLAIARALATDLPVLLLDEPTSGLDPNAEHAVLEALANLRGTKTIVIVTHRETTARIADQIVDLAAWPSLGARGRRFDGHGDPLEVVE